MYTELNKRLWLLLLELLYQRFAGLRFGADTCRAFDDRTIATISTTGNTSSNRDSNNRTVTTGVATAERALLGL